MKKLSLLICMIIILSVATTGCTPDSKELDEQVYTLALGVDKGTENKIRLTLQVPTYKRSGGGTMTKKGGEGGGSEENGVVDGTIVTTVEAPSLLEAINILNTSATRRISLVHAKELVFSEDFAREGIGAYLEPIARFRETRRTMQVIVCKGSAADYIKENKTLIGESVTKAMELSATQSYNTGFFPQATFQEFYEGVMSPYSQAYAVYAGLNDFKNLKPENKDVPSPLKVQYDLLPGNEPRWGDLKRETVGTAVFDGDKMVGSLNAYETRFFLMVTGEFGRGIFTLEDKHKPGAAIPMDVRLGRKPRIKVYFEDGKPVIDVKINIEADLVAVQSRFPYEKLSNIGLLNEQLKSFVENGIKKTIEKTQKELKTDIFGFGGKAAHSFFTIQEFEKYNWLAHYYEALVNVEVEANIRRTGIMVTETPIRYTNSTVITGGE